MKNLIVLAFLITTCLCSFASEKTGTYLLSKNEYKELEANNKLISEAIKNAYGVVSGVEGHKIDIRKVDAWTKEMAEFRYFPDVDVEKRKQFSSGILNSNENKSFKLRVTLNIEKCILNAAMRAGLDENGSFVLNIAVVGDDRVFVTEAIDKEVFLEMVKNQTFTDKTFKKYFGENVMNMNYHIEILKTNVCFLKDIVKPDCLISFELNKADTSFSYFANKVTSKEYSAQYVLFDVLVSKEKSRLTQKANDAVIREADRSEHIKYYFCIPIDNKRPGSGKLIDMEGKIANTEDGIVNDVVVLLKDASNKIIASKITDKEGYFKMEKVEEGMGYTLFVDKSCKQKGLKLKTKANKFVGEFKKGKLGFDYKLLSSDEKTIEVMNEPDPSAEFMTKIKARMVVVTDRINPLKDQTVELRDGNNKLLQTKITDMNGDFEFSDVNLKEIHSIELPTYKEVSKNEKIYLANTKNELVARVNKNAEGKFAYKIIPAEASYITSMEETDVELTFNKQKKLNTGDIVIRDFVYYDVNSFLLTDVSKATLNQILKILNSNPEFKLEIVSHTDCRGENNENLKLSQKRSEAVVDYFSKAGVEISKLKPVGMGESKPLNNCTDGKPCTDEEYKMNRRTEFKFYK